MRSFFIFILPLIMVAIVSQVANAMSLPPLSTGEGIILLFLFKFEFDQEIKKGDFPI